MMDGISNAYEVSGLSGSHVTEQGDVSLRSESTPSTSGLRRGGRVRKPIRAESPDIEEPVAKSKKRGPKSQGAEKPNKPFSCDNCKSPYIVNPKRSISKKDPKRAPAPRYKVDPESGKKLTLCNACGLLFDRQKKRGAKPPVATEADRKKYAEECEKFSQSLACGMNDPEAARFTCTVFQSRACACLQKYIIGDGNPEDCTARTNNLLDLLKQAKVLRLKKCYNPDDVEVKGRKKIGLGNGHKKSKEYEEFVLKKRQYLRNELNLCERAVQKVLLYSNNFLHRRLKTEDQTWRVERVRGKSARGLLKTIEEMQNERCCDDECVLLAKTHSFLLTKWRERATSSQAEARKVLAEMLTPSGGRSNCFNFITMVTGSSARTIGRVREQMRETGGNREPPPHGLKKYWKKHPYNKQPKIPTKTTEASSSSTKSAPADSILNGTDILRSTKDMSQEELQQHQLNLEKMQAQLEEKKRRIQQQQQMVEEQLHQHKLAEQQRQKQQEQQQLIEQQHKLAERQKEQQQQRQAQMVRTNQTDPTQTEFSTRIAQELFSEIQGQIIGQQLHQQLLGNQTTGQAAAQAIQNAAALNASHPPPSYNVAVALNSTNAAGQQSNATGSNQTQQALYFQTSNVQQTQLQNLFLGSNSLHSHQLLGTQTQQSQHSALSSTNQQILVSLAQNLNSLSSDLNGDVSLSDQSSSDTSHDQLNVSDVMSPGSSVIQHLTRPGLHNQNKTQRVHPLVGESSNHEIAILVPTNANNNGSHSSSDHAGTVESLLSSDALQIFSLQSIPVSITMPTIPTQSSS
ncbi:probable basic-leucine zipper transcription factor Q [Anneissia japonica]|uniref:probable basic-leucine zipper transcription factor Q n=1 Tax=Anneissia japonica TaxID=1529436 RepID=UPI0014258159|nr:probable basic-leucine zipper transcription factor Q [Anneissia japonica]